MQGLILHFLTYGTQGPAKACNPQVYQPKLSEYPKSQQVHQTFSVQSLLVLLILEIEWCGPEIKPIPVYELGC